MTREDLEKEGLTKEQIDKVLDMHHKELDPVNKKLEKAESDLKAANDKVTATEEALKKFDGVNPEALNQEITKLKEDLQKKDADHQAEIADRDFQELLKESITTAKGRNAKAITALLDVETLKVSKNQKEDVAAALKALSEAEDSKMLFGESEVIGNGDPIGTVTKGGNANEATASMRSIMGLPPLSEK